MSIKSVMVAMSGGVDSSVAALLLKQQGYNVAGATFLLHEENIENDNVRDAYYVCCQIGIPHYIFDFRELFRIKVIDEFSLFYEHGETPNPCISCNKHIKFAAFFDKAKSLGYNYIATGHYASALYDNEKKIYRLRRAMFTPKDQSYVLYTLTQEQLSAFMTPLGGYTKYEIRDIAEKNSLKTYSKSESQDICFIPGGDYAAFLQRYTERMPGEGNFISESGEILGRHRGVYHYTIGQRKGLGISFGTPMYVTKIDAAKNTVTLGDGTSLWRKSFLVNRVNWIERPAGISSKFDVKIRYAHEASPATVTVLEGGIAKVDFDKAQRAITPGQSAVFYDGDYVAGGGAIMTGN